MSTFRRKLISSTSLMALSMVLNVTATFAQPDICKQANLPAKLAKMCDAQAEQSLKNFRVPPIKALTESEVQEKKAKVEHNMEIPYDTTPRKVYDQRPGPLFTKENSFTRIKSIQKDKYVPVIDKSKVNPPKGVIDMAIRKMTQPDMPEGYWNSGDEILTKADLIAFRKEMNTHFVRRKDAVMGIVLPAYRRPRLSLGFGAHGMLPFVGTYALNMAGDTILNAVGNGFISVNRWGNLFNTAAAGPGLNVDIIYSLNSTSFLFGHFTGSFLRAQKPMENENSPKEYESSDKMSNMRGIIGFGYDTAIWGDGRHRRSTIFGVKGEYNDWNIPFQTSDWLTNKPITMCVPNDKRPECDKNNEEEEENKPETNTPFPNVHHCYMPGNGPFAPDGNKEEGYYCTYLDENGKEQLMEEFPVTSGTDKPASGINKIPAADVNKRYWTVGLFVGKQFSHTLGYRGTFGTIRHSYSVYAAGGKTVSTYEPGSTLKNNIAVALGIMINVDWTYDINKYAALQIFAKLDASVMLFIATSSPIDTAAGEAWVNGIGGDTQETINSKEPEGGWPIYGIPCLMSVNLDIQEGYWVCNPPIDVLSQWASQINTVGHAAYSDKVNYEITQVIFKKPTVNITGLFDKTPIFNTNANLAAGINIRVYVGASLIIKM